MVSGDRPGRINSLLQRARLETIQSVDSLESDVQFRRMGPMPSVNINESFTYHVDDPVIEKSSQFDESEDH